MATRPATAGEVIVFYATGFGSPAGYREGQIIEKALPLAVAPQVVIGGAAIVVSFNGSQSPSGVFLSIR